MSSRSSTFFHVPSIYHKIRMSYRGISHADEEEIENHMFENIHNLTGVQNTHPISNDLITKEEVLNRDHEKNACQLDKDSLLYIIIAYCCGIAAFGRFSVTLCENDNTSFIIVYVIMVIFTAYPITFLEMTLGQYTSKGPLLAFEYCPLFEGIGFSMAMFCLVQPFPIVMNIAYSIFYMFLTLSEEFPWISCHVVRETLSIINGTGCSETPTAKTDIPVVYFWKVYMRANTNGVYMNKNKWHWIFVLSQIICWLFITYSLYKGSRSVYKIIRIILLPSVCLILLFFAISIRTMSVRTVYSLFWIPNLKEFFCMKVWMEAAIEAFLSIGASSGVLLTLGSFYDFRNKFVHKHMLFFIFVSVIINVLMWMFFFINLNSISEKYDTSIRSIFPKGMNLLFLIFPEKIRYWIFPQFFLFIYYFAFATLQSIAVVVLLETFKLCIFSRIPYVAEHKTFWTFIMCTVYLLITLLNTSVSAEGFISEKTLSNIIGRSLIIIGLVELISICIFYGSKKFCTDVEFMRNSRPSYFLRFCWFANIIALTGVIVTFMIKCQITNFHVGLIVTVLVQESILIPIPIIIVFNMYKFIKNGNYLGVTKPRPTAGPKYGIFKAMRESFDGIER